MSLSKQAYEPGDLILTADPLVHVLRPSKKGKQCDNCCIERYVHDYAIRFDA
jgi:hypothetical protein